MSISAQAQVSRMLCYLSFCGLLFHLAIVALSFIGNVIDEIHSAVCGWFCLVFSHYKLFFVAHNYLPGILKIKAKLLQTAT